MPSLYPSSYDSLTDPVGGQPRNTPGMEEVTLISNLNDAVENLQEYVGTSSETSTATLTGKVKQLDSLTTKGDLLYNNGTTLTRLPRGSDGYILSSDATDGLKYISPTSGGTVTDVSVVSANGFTGSVANATTSPDITIATSVTGLLKGNGTAVSSASQGTDYFAPGGTDVGVADGGTGVSSLTAYAPIFGGTTTTGPIQQVSVGTAGQVLTSNGAGALPTMQNAVGNKIYVSPTQVSRTSGSSDETMYTFTLPGNILGTSNAIKGEVFISGLATNGSPTSMSIKVFYGGASNGVTVQPDPYSSGVGKFEFVLVGNGTTSSQKIISSVQLTYPYPDEKTRVSITTGTYTKDSTVDQTISITTHPSASGQSCTMEGILVTKIV